MSRISTEDAYKAAQIELGNRGYELKRQYVVDETFDDHRIIEQWVNYKGGPTLMLEFYVRGGWELYGAIDSTNSTDETWTALDKILGASAA